MNNNAPGKNARAILPLLEEIQERDDEITKLLAEIEKYKWQPAENAPKTGEMILADMGWPWTCLVCWNNYENKWVYVSQQMNFVDGADDPYFENEYCDKTELKRWMPLPELPTVK